MNNPRTTSIEVVDSHAGGEPTRVVLSGGPELPGGNLAAAVAELRNQHDHFRRTLDASEQRGADGSLIDHVELFGPPSDPAAAQSRNFVLRLGNVDIVARSTLLFDDGDPFATGIRIAP